MNAVASFPPPSPEAKLNTAGEKRDDVASPRLFTTRARVNGHENRGPISERVVVFRQPGQLRRRRFHCSSDGQDRNEARKEDHRVPSGFGFAFMYNRSMMCSIMVSTPHSGHPRRGTRAHGNLRSLGSKHPSQDRVHPIPPALVANLPPFPGNWVSLSLS